MAVEDNICSRIFLFFSLKKEKSWLLLNANGEEQVEKEKLKVQIEKNRVLPRRWRE